MKRRRLSLVLLVAYGVASVLDVVGEAADLWQLRIVCLWLLMPLLAGFLLAARSRPTRLTNLVLVALFFSWLGDVAGEPILIKIAFFLVSQVVYITVFWPYRQRGVLHRPLVLLAYAAVVLAMVALVGSAAGSLLLPVIVYGGCLGLMAVVASGYNLATALGGVAFIISDSVLAIDTFVTGITIPASGVWIMLTYVLAQGFLVVGVWHGDGAAVPPAPRRRPLRGGPATRHPQP